MMETADAATVNGWLEEMAGKLRSMIRQTPAENIVMIGIQSGGVRIAEQLHSRLALDAPSGTLNISFYRDDFSRIGLHPHVTPSTLPFDVENRTVILVDDVLYSGRTVRAALNEIFDYGRPSRVILAVLVEREGQELPIRADVAGHTLALKPTEQVKLHPDKLSLELHDGVGANP
jgi:pyrimidine operon attenuation protein/uracil phosphoribosyltransferase